MKDDKTKALMNMVSNKDNIMFILDSRATSNLYKTLSTPAIEANMEDDLDEAINNIKKFIEKELEVFYAKVKRKQERMSQMARLIK